ncbi:hypothetical protein L227DRAFT_476283, partial [Lentinus tigrinus ALCF2SS1-6]
DSKAALQASTITRPHPGHYLTDLFHSSLLKAATAHPAMDRVTLRWVPGHMNVHGNELADDEAKQAARGASSATATLPAGLRKSLSCSATAAKRAHLARLRREAAETWRASKRGRRLAAIDPSLPSTKFLKRTETLPRRHTAALIQLRSGHAPLYKHLNRIQRAPTARCPACNVEHETVRHFLLYCP